MCSLNTTFRKLLAGLAVLAILWPTVTNIARAQEVIDLILFEVGRDPDTGQVRIRTPLVRIEVGPQGTRVRSPFVGYRSRRYEFPYENIQSSPPRPETVDTVRVEIDSSVKVIVPPARLAAQPALRSARSPKRAPSRGRETDAPPAPNLGDAEPFPGTKPPAAGQKKDDVPQPAGTKPAKNPTKEQPAVKSSTKPPALIAAASSPPSYLVIPLTDRQPIPGIQVAIQRRGQREPAPPALVPPAPAAEPEENIAKDKPATAKQKQPIQQASSPPPASQRLPGKSVYNLTPMWHTEIPLHFQPAGGIHLFAIIHPRTLQTVVVQVSLPPGQPRLKLKRDEIEFDYGRFEVEIDFKRDGRVVVKYDD